MKKNILKKFAIAIASTAMVVTTPVTMPNVSALNTIQTVEAATVKTPSAVTLSKVSATAYNKIEISWKKVNNATNYYIYCRKTGTSKWTKIASVKSTTTSYTHKSSAKYPIVVGQKYDYTVKAYNSKSKKTGKYNTKGLTVKTIPNSATEISIVAKNGKVNISWEKANGANKYIIYRKTSPAGKWVKLATVSNTEYTDNNPVAKQDNYYTVRSYYSKTKAYGNYNKHGIEVYVPAYTPVVTPKPTDPTPTEKPEPTITPDPDPDIDDDDPTPTPKPEPNAEQMAQEVIRLTNIERAKYGCAPLKYHAGLQQAAMVRAREIAIYFSHTRPDGRDCETALAEAGVGCPGLENIGRGYSSPEEVMRGWINSLGHKAAMLKDTDTHIGVGFYKAPNGIYCWVQEFSSDPDKKCTITCNANGGTFVNGNATTITEFPCKMHVNYANLPVPTRNGYTFDGWTEFGDKITGGRLTTNVNLTAAWVPNN